MASFWVESIRAAAVGTLALSSSYAFYRHSISSNTGYVQLIQDKNVVGVRLPPLDPAVEKVMHNTKCLTEEKHYRKLSETDREVYFEKPAGPVASDFKADCVACGAGSVILYDKHERDPAFEYVSWTI
jgi:hypothetical protein